MDSIQKLLTEKRNECFMLFTRLVERKVAFLLHTELIREFEVFCATEPGAPLKDTFMRDLIYSAQEAVVLANTLYFSLRIGVGQWQYIRIDWEDMCCAEVKPSEFLEIKERLVDPAQVPEAPVLEVDLSPFDRGLPHLKDPRSIGKGVEFLNRHLSNVIFEDEGKGEERLFSFLRVHNVGGRPLMINQIIENARGLHAALNKAEKWLATVPDTAEWTDVGARLEAMGFERGWGRTVAKMRETMGLLADLLEAPEPRVLADFLARLPMIFNIVILSPHGYFGQSGVLGMPDTGGQVVYILDQVRALEREMKRSIHEQGLDIDPTILVITRLIPDAQGTSCDQPVEPISGTQHARILRVPFRTETGEVVPHWISRFRIWPYLERFAMEVEKEIRAETGGRIDFVIGNYSDGNLVASLLCKRLGVTQCNIAHALEKTKYLHSDLYWKEHENEHHFSSQFSADLMAMNTADFIITSSYQEIAGTADAVGQYESYGSFTMPGLFRTLKGVDVFDPKFNIVSPGVNEEVFFPYTETDRRIPSIRETVADLLYGTPDGQSRGQIKERDKPLLFTMARLDPVKNVAGFLEWYATDEALRAQVNVVMAGGYIDPSRSRDETERQQIERIHALFDEHGLDDQVRWIDMQTDKNIVGELYRSVADTRGAFVQPALFEAFGLTVLEAMASGLPTFATCFGGPLEIIEDGRSGFHIDPNNTGEAAACLTRFFETCASDPDHWATLSKGCIARVQEKYTWTLYARRLLSLSRIYGFWKHISGIKREATRRYLDMFYHLMYKPRAAQVDTDR
jgi:sucrose synthase